MSRHEHLIHHACKTADRRKRIYGVEPSPGVAALLSNERAVLTFRETCRLLGYIYFRSPQHRLKLLWMYLTDRDTPVRKHQIELLAEDLRSCLNGHCRIAGKYFERRNYSRDLARVQPWLETAIFRTTPSLVVQPRDERDIAEILGFCQSRGLPAIPRGSGSFAFGGTVPTLNGIVLDLSPMKAVLEVDPEKPAVRVQPGARWADVAAKLDPYGLVPMTTPTSRFSTVAGWVSTGGFGLHGYAYGPVFESVLGARVVRPQGAIEEMGSGSESIKDLFGTEGQMGILSEITLRVRPKPEYSGTCLLAFDTPHEAFQFIEQLTRSGQNPSHVVFFDREYMSRENVLFSEHTGLKESIVPERDSVLLHFETPGTERKCLSWLNENGNQPAENPVAGRYLWSDRYFPLKAQRIGPGLLGTEVVIPPARASKYIARVRKLSRHFNIKPAIEVMVCRDGGSCSCLVILSFSCDYARSIHYVLSLLLVQLLVRLAVRCGGHPYGIGIWNTPFVKSKYDQRHLAGLKERKSGMDPLGTLNPNKFFRIRGRFFSIPAFAMHPAAFRAILALFHFFAPVLGLFARLAEPVRAARWEVPAKEEEQGQKLLLQCAERCTSCGSCISVCPAYHLTEDELVAGRTKLRMAEAMMNGAAVERSEAHAPFQCLHCGLCEEVCQTRLPLRDCYVVLEDWIESRFGSPAETVQRFVEKLDGNRECIKEIFGLDLPEWCPGEPPARVPAVEPRAEGGEA